MRGATSGRHACPVCGRMILNSQAMCKRDWGRLEPAQRSAIWASLRYNGAGTKAHVKVIEAAAETLR